MGNEHSLSMPLPLDDDGFLRRECPNCERDFMALYTDNEADETTPETGGYRCPYCGLEAGPNEWWTKEQLAQARSIAVSEVVQPMLREFGRNLERSGSGFVKVKTEISQAESPAPLVESNDMHRIDFACHPADPVKVLAEWDRGVHCTICGAVSA